MGCADHRRPLLWRCVAIYTLQHAPIGRSTHEPGASAAYARYIFRDDGCSTIVAHLPGGVPVTRLGIARWLLACERSDRANARVCDRVMVAIPAELAASSRSQLVREFADALTERRVPYAAAIHDMLGDDDNPHCHMILRDRAFEGSRRVMMTSESGSTEWIRQVWERTANAALEREGRYERIDRRSLVERGIDRLPGFHLGPNRRSSAA